MKMNTKFNIFYLLIGAIMIFASCEPREDRNELGPVYTPDQLSSYVDVKVEGNKVTCTNTAPGVISYWSTEFGTQSNQNTAEFYIPLKSSYNATLTAFCAGGPVTISKPFTIENSDLAYYSSPYWQLLTNGIDGKTWVWANDIPGGKVWGNGGYKGSTAPGWWTLGVGELDGQGGSPNDEITFNLDKSHNFIVTMPGVKDRKPGSGQGKFNIDFSKTITLADTLYSKGQITFNNWTIPLGFEPNTAGKPLHYTFDILKLTENELVLSFPSPGVKDAWGEAWFYMFKRKGYTYPAQ
jgi:hypothetical protein